MLLLLLRLCNSCLPHAIQQDPILEPTVWMNYNYEDEIGGNISHPPLPKDQCQQLILRLAAYITKIRDIQYCWLGKLKMCLLLIFLINLLMEKLILIFLALLLDICSVPIKKMSLIWLNNGGGILSSSSDWITVVISTPNLPKSIVCKEREGYVYYPGTARRFSGLWFPVSTHLSITLIQHNVFRKDESAIIAASINSTDVGYYGARIDLTQFRYGMDISLNYMGIGLTLDLDNYVQIADYYLLLQMHEEEVANGSYSLDPTCFLREPYYYAFVVTILFYMII